MKLNLRPKDEMENTVERPAGPADVGLDPRLAGTGVIWNGGFGKLAYPAFVGFCMQNGVYVPSRHLDSDHQPPQALRLPDGRPVRLRAGDFLPIGTAHARNALKDEPLLVRRYIDGGLLRGISVFETYSVAGRGGGGFPVVGAIDVELGVREIRGMLVSLLREMSGSGAPGAGVDPWAELAGESNRRAIAPAPARIVIVGGGCGSPGPAGHILLPYLVRAVARDLGLPDPFLIGVVAGSRMWRNLTPRVGSNYLATLQQLDLMSREGLRWEFIDGTQIDDDAPPYSRIILVDGEPAQEKATEAELAQLAARVAKSLFAALTSDVFERLEALMANGERTPWTTLQGVQARVDWELVKRLATVYRAKERLELFQATAA